MKKIKLFGYILLSVLLSLLFVLGANAEEEEYLPAESDMRCSVRADVIPDGRIDAADARQILRFAVELDEAESTQAIAADIDGDAEITSSDARLALRIAVGLDPLPSHVKAFTLTLQTPTCQTTGFASSVCAYCNCTYNAGVLPTVDHKPAGWETIQKATCKEEGYAQQKCVFCGLVINTETLEKRPHEYDYNQPVFIEETPDCTRTQRVSYECINCGEPFETIRQASKYHTFDWVRVSAPTCTDPGREEKICTLCGVKNEPEEYRLVPSLGFDFHSPEWVVQREATPEEDGLRIYRCTVCGVILEEEEFPFIAEEPPIEELPIEEE